jgi:CheY-like chemotaxis protein
MPPFPRPLVLLVEDSEDDAFFFRWTLDKCGYECDVVHAADGVAAIQQLETALAGSGGRVPDIIFVDLKIPRVDGFDVLSWINERRIEPAPSVAVLSGSEHVADIQRAHALGASAFYVKPLSLGQLRARLAGWHAKHLPPETPPGSDVISTREA